MKRFLLLSFFTFLCAYISMAQEQQVKVVLQSGASIVGELKNIDGVNSLTIVVGGVESEIPMADVATIEPIVETKQQQTINSDPFAVLPSAEYGKYVVTDDGDYPEQFVILAGNQELTMVLVRGGVFNMGYDGSRSTFMDSEPVHKVKVSSFYVSKYFISNYAAYTLLYGQYKGKNPGSLFNTRDWNKARDIAATIAAQEDAPYRLLTEAEWEYMAVGPKAEQVFSEIISSSYYSEKYHIGEWCNDFWAQYVPIYQIDPQGPEVGKKHVARSFGPDRYKWNRDQRDVNKGCEPYRYFVRVAISADQIIDKIR